VCCQVWDEKFHLAETSSAATQHHAVEPLFLRSAPSLAVYPRAWCRIRHLLSWCAARRLSQELGRNSVPASTPIDVRVANCWTNDRKGDVLVREVGDIWPDLAERLPVRARVRCGNCLASSEAQSIAPNKFALLCPIGPIVSKVPRRQNIASFVEIARLW